MIHDLRILSGGDDLEAQAAAAVTSRGMTETIRHRHGHIYHGHDAASDDAKSYPEMVQNFGRDHMQPMLDRTHGNATPAEIRAAATAAEKGAARLIAFADKCHRHAARLEAAEQAREED
jgi:hypothetical protein